MDYINYVENPSFFMKVFNSISVDKRYEFTRKFEEFKSHFGELYDSLLFNPRISFEDCFIIIRHDDIIISKIDLREDLEDKVLLSEDLLEDILEKLNITHGLYVTGTSSATEKIIKDNTMINNDTLCEKIEKILN